MKAIKLILISMLILMGYSAHAQKVRGSFEASEYDRESAEKREAGFTGWMPGGKAGELMIRSELEGKPLLLIERKLDGTVRVIIDVNKNNAAANVEYNMSISEEQLLKKHALRKKGGYELLFLKKNPGRDYYCAIWTKKTGYADSLAMLKKLGVTPAKIQITIAKPSAVLNNDPVTTKKRRWIDKKGRVVMASLVEIDGDKAILGKEGGGRFPFLIKNLSVEDQQFLKKVLAEHNDPEKIRSEKEQTAGGFTDWMDFSDFELNFADEESTGRYAIYIESNNKREMRAIYAKKPRNLGWFNGWLYKEEKIRGMNKLYQAQGLTLLSLSFERRTQRYCAVWIAKRNLADAKIQMEKAKISAAEIGKKIRVSKVGKK